MCGFAGFVGFDKLSSHSEIHKITTIMGNTIRHRGLDSSGIWLDNDAQVALIHRRLSILDLSVAGHQPMLSQSERYVIVFNGEIYNHLDLRKNLESLSSSVLYWRGHSDTETLLACIESLGLSETLKQCIGMFAFALWDRKDRFLYLARDRMGEKPLYYGFQGATFLFGSEIKAIACHPAFIGNIDRNSLTLYLRHNYIPGPHSIYKDIHKLEPASILKISFKERTPAIEYLTYWSFQDVANKGQSDLRRLNKNQAVDKLNQILISSIKGQMLSDVPIGAFLSGGIDSSTIVAIMQSQSSNHVKTFSVGFNDQNFDEAPYAARVAEHLGTDHNELYVSADDAMAKIPSIPLVYDEPFSDSSQIPTLLISQFASAQVKVVLSGDAGDELFAGYNRYLATRKFWQWMSRAPIGVRNAIAAIVTTISPQNFDKLYSSVNQLSLGIGRISNFGDKLHKGARLLKANNLDEVYLNFISHWDFPSTVVIGGDESGSRLGKWSYAFDSLDSIHHMMAMDSVTYLPDDILVKVDRAAMSSSLETRVPLLDHRIVEYAWSLPLDFKIHNGQTKWILRQVLNKYVPQNLIERPKMGFGIPLGSWLRGPLRDWAEDLLDEKLMREEGYLRQEPIRQLWNEHLSCSRNWQYHIWDILMFQAWLRHSKEIIH